MKFPRSIDERLPEENSRGHGESSQTRAFAPLSEPRGNHSATGTWWVLGVQRSALATGDPTSLRGYLRGDVLHERSTLWPNTGNGTSADRPYEHIEISFRIPPKYGTHHSTRYRAKDKFKICTYLRPRCYCTTLRIHMPSPRTGTVTEPNQKKRRATSGLMPIVTLGRPGTCPVSHPV